VEKRKQQAANNVWHGTEAADGTDGARGGGSGSGSGGRFFLLSPYLLSSARLSQVTTWT
jgi:hypothetical protein